MPEPSVPNWKVAPAPLSDGRKPVPALQASALSRALVGMAARGHGIDFLCICLGLARAALLDRIVELGLSTPHDRALRQPCGRHPWSFSDTALFIVLWMDGWRAQSLALHFGRSPSSVWAKARHLGLPGRNRKQLFTPSPVSPATVDHPAARSILGDAETAMPSGQLCEPASLAQAGATCMAAPCASPPAVFGASAGSPDLSLSVDSGAVQGSLFTVLTPTQPETGLQPAPPGPAAVPKLRRSEIEWVRSLDIELGRRWWARQHYRSIAEAMGISPIAVQSRRFRIGLPSLFDLGDLFIFRREELVDHFDPTVVDVHIAAAGYVERRCNQFARVGKDFWFWSKHADFQFTSDEWARNEERQQKRQRDAMDRPGRQPPARGFSLHLS